MAIMIDVKILLLIAWAFAITYHGATQDIPETSSAPSAAAATEPVSETAVANAEATTVAENGPETTLETESSSSASFEEVTTTVEEIVYSSTVEASSTTEEVPTTTTKPPHYDKFLIIRDKPTTSSDEKFFNSDDKMLQETVGNTRIKIILLSLAPILQDPKKMVAAICQAIDETEPEIIFDFTQERMASEAVKITTRSLKIPTIAVSPGFPGDLRSWPMNPKESQYLIQVAPVKEIDLRVLRYLAQEHKLENMAIFYGREYAHLATLPSLQKSLFADVGVRQIFVPMMKNFTDSNGKGIPLIPEIVSQIEHMLKNQYSTLVFTGTLKEICHYVKASTKAKMTKPVTIITAGSDQVLTLCSPVFNKPRTLVQISPEKVFQPPKEDPDVAIETIYERYLVGLAIEVWWKLKEKNEWLPPLTVKCRNYKLESRALLENRVPDSFRFKEMLERYQSGGNMDRLKHLLRRMDGGGQIQFSENGNTRFNISYNIKITQNDSDTGLGGKIMSSKDLSSFQTKFDPVQGVVSPEVAKRVKPPTVYRVVTVVQPPFVYHKTGCKPKHKFDHCFYGYAIDVLNEIQKQLGFNYTIFNVSSYGFIGDRLPYRWDGMVRVLQDQQAEIAVGAISAYPEREQVIDFTHNVYGMVGFQVLMKEEKLKTALFKFMTVLENDVWMCILGAFFFTSGLMWVFDRWSPYSYQNNRDKYEDDEEKREFTLKESLWFCMTSLTPQGGGEAPKNLSGRLVAATWWLFGFIIIASYTANLAAFLTVSRLEKRVESLDDLTKQFRVQYAPVDKSSTWHHFDRMAHVEHAFYEVWKDMSLNDSLSDYERAQLAVWEYPVSDKYTKIWQAVLENGAPKDADDAVIKIKNIIKPRGSDPNEPEDLGQEFAWISESTEIKYHYMRNCEFRIVGDEFAKTPYSFMVQKGSPLKQILSKEIRRLESLRYLEKFDRKWWDYNPDQIKCAKMDNLADGISVGNIGGVFVIIMVGLTSTILALIMECWWYYRSQEVDELSEADPSEDKERAATFSATYLTLEKTDFSSAFSNMIPLTESVA